MIVCLTVILINCICLSVILINWIYRKDKNYCPQVFLEECKYVAKEKKKSYYIPDDINIHSDDSDREISDYSDEENPNEQVRWAGIRNWGKFVYFCTWILKVC